MSSEGWRVGASGVKKRGQRGKEMVRESMEMVRLALRDSLKSLYWFVYLKGSPLAITLGRVGHQNNKSVPSILVPSLIRFPFILCTHSYSLFAID